MSAPHPLNSERWVDTEEAARILGYTYRRSLSYLIRSKRVRSRLVKRSTHCLPRGGRRLVRERECYEVEVESLREYLASRRRGGKGTPRTKKRFKHDRGEECRCPTCRNEGLNINVQVRLTEEMFAHLQAAAHRETVPQTEVVRRALTDYFELHGYDRDSE